MNGLDMCIAMAKLEGEIVTGILGNSVMAIGFTHGYNPITDLALNCAARDKYEVEINYSTYTATCLCNKNLGVTSVEVDKASLVCRAVIECILKSKGLYK